MRHGGLRRQPVAPDGHAGAVRRATTSAVLERGGDAGNPAAELASLEHDPAITGIMLGTRNEVSINGVSVFAMAGKAVRGPLLLSTVTGRLPSGDGDIALGTTTLHQVGAHVGSVVHVTVQAAHGAARARLRFAWSGRRRSPASSASGDWAPGRRSRWPAT